MANMVTAKKQSKGKKPIQISKEYWDGKWQMVGFYTEERKDGSTADEARPSAAAIAARPGLNARDFRSLTLSACVHAASHIIS